MKKNFASILITNYNKGSFLKRTLKSCLRQNYKDKEILVYDDSSTDNSQKIIKTFKKKIKITINKKKRFKSGPLNQINGIVSLVKKSKGEFIFFLDGDDEFKNKKLKYFTEIFIKNKNLNFIQDTPFFKTLNRYITLKKKFHIFSIWPSFYPTSCIIVRKKFLLNFFKYLKKENFPNLEIDARLVMYAFLKKQFLKTDKSFTIYNHDKKGITSNYKKYHTLWWIKRNEAFSYFIFLHKKLKIKFFYSADFFLTRLINFFIKF